MNSIWLPSLRSPCAGVLNLSRGQREVGRLFRRGIEVSQSPNSRLQTCIRPYSILSRPFRRRLQDLSVQAHKQSPSAVLRHSIGFNYATLPPASTPAGVFGNLFRKLKDIDEEDNIDGPRFRTKDLTQEEITRIFGPGVPEDIGNRVLRFQHGRRLDGTLDDNRHSPADDMTKKLASTALAWLRAKYPVDEKRAYRARIKEEESRRQTEIIADAERIGIYKPQSGVKKGDVYGKSGLDEIREEYARRAKEKKARMEAAAKRQAKEVKKKTGALEKFKHKTELKRVETSKWVAYHRDRAVLSDHTIVPDLSKKARIVPSAIVALLVVIGSIFFSEYYTFPSPSSRLFPDIPPAAATILSLILLNTAILIAWRIPPCWRTLNKYFVSVPGYPYALSILGNIFSHQQFSHYLLNMAVLWFVGTKLHDQIGRANFLAIYLSSGVIGSLLSLTSYILSGNLISASLGASGAITGILGAWCMVNSREKFRVIFLPENWFPPISSTNLLLSLLAVEITGICFGFKGVDHWAHLGGFFTGIAAAYWLRWRIKRRGLREEFGGVDRWRASRMKRDKVAGAHADEKGSWWERILNGGGGR